MVCILSVDFKRSLKRGPQKRVISSGYKPDSGSRSAVGTCLTAIGLVGARLCTHHQVERTGAAAVLVDSGPRPPWSNVGGVVLEWVSQREKAEGEKGVVSSHWGDSWWNVDVSIASQVEIREDIPGLGQRGHLDPGTGTGEGSLL